MNPRPAEPRGRAGRPSVVVLDYGFGNVRSAVRALERVGARVELTADHTAALGADGLVVPGVGAFAACMAGIRAVRGDQVVERRLAGGRPVLGICVGMQVMFDSGVEHGVQTDGLGQWRGVVEKLDAPVVPHMGWSTLEAPAGTRLLAGVEDERFYFVHSYAAQSFTQGHDDAADPRFVPPRVTWSHHGSAEHGARFVAAVEDGPLAATQFHPEKSGDAGATLLENWVRSL
ncbi:imidazole glycerol phosphate synthase subunit HisH [Xylanimonas oleitrophica]|uniref:imidazole glycerol phosphate synthase subunit HisH n=1 Tax=Xylanimonas oleitrophica TaxID=2607479 RepID=UPI0015CFEEDC|nr:imidazole glycerol phosphate synthase subunit HisH [Xylanimonas oleitrophica]